MTHLPLSPMLNAAGFMTHLEIQGCLNDSSSDCDITVAKEAYFPQGVSTVDHQNPALNYS